MQYQKIKLTDILHKQQMYVDKAAKELGIPVQAVLHDMATNTCHEKAEIIGWQPQRVIKASFFYNGKDAYGFVLPELGTEEKPSFIDIKKTLIESLGQKKDQNKGGSPENGYSGKEAKKFFTNGYIPEGMEYGTCTPFVLEETLSGKDSSLKGIVVHEMPSLDDQLVDISIGGKGEEHHRISVHLPYSGIYEILKKTFGDKIKRLKLKIRGK